MKSSEHHSDSTLSTFTAGDGDNLAVQHWPVDPGEARRGVVVLVHGLGEHAGRYEHVAQWLTARGFTVYGYDQCGHGDSSGARGCLPNTMRLIEDLLDVVQSARRRMRAGEPLIVLGHSLGAVVAGCLVQLRSEPVEGLVLSSPAFAPRLSPLRRLLLMVARRLAPNLTVRNGVAPETLSHDPDVVRGYRDDPRVHNRVSARLGYFIAEAGPRLARRAPRWKVPTLLLYAGTDALVHPSATRRFAAAAPPSLVTPHCFDELFHEVLNEEDAEPVYAALQDWLDRLFPARPAALRPPTGAGDAAAAPATPAPPRTQPRAAATPS